MLKLAVFDRRGKEGDESRETAEDFAKRVNDFLATQPTLRPESVTYGTDQIYVLWKDSGEPAHKETMIKAVNISIAKYAAEQIQYELDYRFWYSQHVLKNGGTAKQGVTEQGYNNSVENLNAKKTMIRQARDLLKEIEAETYTI